MLDKFSNDPKLHMIFQRKETERQTMRFGQRFVNKLLAKNVETLLIFIYTMKISDIAET